MSTQPNDELAELRAENERLKMGLWDTWVALGHDTDGDKHPGHLIAGMGVDGFIGMVVRDATTWRRESEDDYDADTDRLERRAKAAEAKVTRVEAALDIRTRARAWMAHLGYEDHQIDKAKAWRQPIEPWLQDDPPMAVVDLETAAGIAREYEEAIRAALAGPAAPEATVYASQPHDREIFTPDATAWPGHHEHDA